LARFPPRGGGFRPHRGPANRPAWIAFCAAAAALALGGNAAHAQEGSLEYPVKAAFLYKFGSFVEWPPAAFAGPGAPVTLCIVGRDPFGPVLDSNVQGQTIETRPIVVRRLAVVSPASGCHIAYLGGSPEQSTAEAARALAGAPVLTVTDEAVRGARGVVHFVIAANRVRFRIDQRTASAGGLTISSKLLNLAVEVVR
jgi:hypothetical protein